MRTWWRSGLLAGLVVFLLPLPAASPAGQEEVYGARLTAALRSALVRNEKIVFRASQAVGYMTADAPVGATSIQFRYAEGPTAAAGDSFKGDVSGTRAALETAPSQVFDAPIGPIENGAFVAGETLIFGSTQSEGIAAKEAKSGDASLQYFLTTGAGTAVPAGTVVRGVTSNASTTITGEPQPTTRAGTASGSGFDQHCDYVRPTTCTNAVDVIEEIRIGTDEGGEWPGLKITVGRFEGRIVLGLHLVVYFSGFRETDLAKAETKAANGEDLSSGVPDAVLDLYKPVFSRASDILYDTTEGTVYIERVELTSAFDRKSAAHVWISPAGATSKGNGAVADPVGWQNDGRVYLILEQHLCDEDCGNTGGVAFECLKNAWPERAADLREKCDPGHRAPFGIAHELGHYLFGLEDEYNGQVWLNCSTEKEDLTSCIDCKTKLTENRRTVPHATFGTFTLPAENSRPPASCFPDGTYSEAINISVPARRVTMKIETEDTGTDLADDVDFQLLSPTGDVVQWQVGNAPPFCSDAGTVKVSSPPVGKSTDGFTTYVPSQGSASGKRFIQWLIVEPPIGTWTVVVSPRSTAALSFSLQSTQDRECSYRCSFASRNTEDCEPEDNASFNACVMDGGTTIVENNQKRELCTRGPRSETVAGNIATAHDAGQESFSFSGDRCQVYMYVNGQEIGLAQSCWETIHKGVFLRDVKAAAKSLSDAERESLLVPPKTPAKQVLDPCLRPLYETVGRATALTAGNPLALQAIDDVPLPPGPAYIIALDVSGSMEEKVDVPAGCVGSACLSKADLVVRSVRDAVSLMKPAERFGVISFADDVTTIQALTTKRDGGQMFLDTVLPDSSVLTFGDRTAMGDALLDANDMLEGLGGDEATSKVVLVISDGRNNTGTDLEDALAELQETSRLSIHTVALGADADVDDLSTLARDTGGTFWFARSPADVSVTSILPRIVAGIRGEEEILTRRATATSAAFLEETVQVDAFTDEATFVCASPDAGDLEFEVLDVNGDPLDPLDEGVLQVEFDSHTYYRVLLPAAGTYTLRVRAAAGTPAAGIPLTLLAFTRTPRLSIRTTVRSRGRVVYPEPMIIETIVGAPNPITGLSVQMTVKADGASGAGSVITMRDDGSVESGDLKAGDGIYTGIYADYEVYGADVQLENGSVLYVVDVVAENVVTSDASGAFIPSDDGLPPEPIDNVREPFTITDTIRLLVDGSPSGRTPYGLIGTGRLLPRTQAVADLEVTPVYSFSVRAIEEYLLLDSVTLELEIPKPAVGPATRADYIQMVGLYWDKDEDGVPDNRYAPISWAWPVEVADEPTLKRYTVTFELPTPVGGDPRALALLPVGDPNQMLVTIGQPRAARPAPTQPLSAPGGGRLGPMPPRAPIVPPLLVVIASVVALGLLLATYRMPSPRVLRQCTTAGFVACLFLTFMAVGCGSGGDGSSTALLQQRVDWFNNGTTGPGGERSDLIPPIRALFRRQGPWKVCPPSDIAGTYRWTLDSDTVKARSLRQQAMIDRDVDGDPVVGVVDLK